MHNLSQPYLFILFTLCNACREEKDAVALPKIKISVTQTKYNSKCDRESKMVDY